MALVEWSDKLSVGVREFDEQHRKLIELINLLHEYMSKGKGKEVLGDVLDELVSYTEYHFKAEEKLMEKYKYPGYTTHSIEHDKLTLKVRDLKKRYDNAESVISIEVMTFLSDWLKHHILSTDKKYGSFFISKGVS